MNENQQSSDPSRSQNRATTGDPNFTTNQQQLHGSPQMVPSTPYFHGQTQMSPYSGGASMSPPTPQQAVPSQPNYQPYVGPFQQPQYYAPPPPPFYYGHPPQYYMPYQPQPMPLYYPAHPHHQSSPQLIPTPVAPYGQAPYPYGGVPAAMYYPSQPQHQFNAPPPQHMQQFLPSQSSYPQQQEWKPEPLQPTAPQQNQRVATATERESTQAITTPRQSSISTSLDQSNTTTDAAAKPPQAPVSAAASTQQQQQQMQQKPTMTTILPQKQSAQPLSVKEPQKSDQSLKCKVVLSVKCETRYDQRVAIVGNAVALGSWEISRPFLLNTEESTYPTWKCQFFIDESEGPLEYKFIKLTKRDDGQMEAEWENINDNRSIDTLNCVSVVADAAFGVPGHQKETCVPRKPLVTTTQAPSKHPKTLYSLQSMPVPAQKKASSLLPQQTADMNKTRTGGVNPYPGVENVANKPVTPFLSQTVPGAKMISTTATAAAEQKSLDLPLQKEIKQSRRQCNRQKLKKQLLNAFPSETGPQKKEQTRQDKLKRPGYNSDTTSNTNQSHESKNTSTFYQNRQKRLQLAQNNKQKTVKLDPNECIVQVTHQLPYRLISREDGQFIAEPCYQSPTLLYANLDELAQTKMYNFVWVGIVVTKHAMTQVELENAEKLLVEKNCYAVFFTEEELNPYLRFYEGLIRPNMHNFTDPSDHLKQDLNYWAEFKNINRAIARRVQQVRQLVDSNTVWIHGDQNMLVPFYIRQSEKSHANIGFYFHQAFPASAVFASFYKRGELLQSLLHADLIGFHIWEYARNFINSCQRLLGLYYELGVGNTLSVNYNKRSIQVRISHIGLDESFVQKIMDSVPYDQAQRMVINTVRSSEKKQQQQAQMRGSLSRNNLNASTGMRSASQPMLIGSALSAMKNSASITSTLASSNADNDSIGITDSMQGKIIMASIDSFHQMTGLTLKLKGYYNFLKMYPEYRNKVVLFQVIRGLFVKSENMKGQQPEEESKQSVRNNQKGPAMWLHDQVDSLRVLNNNIIKLVKKIRTEFGRQCLIVESSGNWSVHMRLGLWSRANVLFVSTLKDGLYLTCFEYILVKYLSNNFKNSAMILSEFTGCNSQFAGFYDFNPFQLKSTVVALEKCLKDSPQEKEDRMKRAYQFCRQRTFQGWVENFLKELKLAYDPNAVDYIRIIYQGLQAVQCASTFNGLESSTSTERPQMPIPVDIKRQAVVSVSARKNLIMIDHEALPLKQLGRSEMCPRIQIILWLQEILYDKNNIVVIMSDQGRNYVSSVFEQNLMDQENFWVAAESGYWLMSDKKRWNELFKVQSKQWMQTIRKIMEAYCENIDGAVVEERSCTVVWNYKNAEEEHGSKFANELAQHLHSLLGRNSPIEITHGNGFIEVLPKKMAKKTVLKNIFSNLQLYCNHQIESFLFIGAGFSDNQTYQYIKDRIEEDKHISGTTAMQNRPLFAAKCNTTLCVLGHRPSLAQYYLEQKDLQYLLQEMAFKSKSRKRTKSMTNLLDTPSSTDQPSATHNNFDPDYESNLLENNLNVTPQKKSKLKGRHMSHTNLFQPNFNTEKYKPDDDMIPETNEEDDMTQLSEYRQVEQPLDQLSNYEGFKNGSENERGRRSQYVISSDVKELLGAVAPQKDHWSKFRVGHELHQQKRQRTISASDAAFELERVTISKTSSEFTNHMNRALFENEPTSPGLKQSRLGGLGSATNMMQRTHESASMPQLQGKGGTTPVSVNVQLPFHASSKNSDSAKAVKTSNTMPSNGSVNGATCNEEINAIAIEALDLQTNTALQLHEEEKCAAQTPSIVPTANDLKD